MTPAEPRDNLSTAQRALYEIRTLKAKIAELERAQKEPVAIVGLGVRFPGGASTPDSFWDLLSNGVDAGTEIPSSRWPIDQYYNADPDAPGKMYARHGAFLGDPALFDADFFGISPREAMSLDPQHRLVLEVAWEALENAGRSPSSLAGSSSGVFLAASNSDYGRMVYRQAADIDAYSGIGNIFSVMAGRISYLLGLHGPSMVVDTACSGSLVALHLACQSLRARECHLALAGGVNLILSPEIHINFSKSRMMSQDGKCKTFDAGADGYVRGEGCGMVVLKRLSDALADGDQVLSVVYSSAVNQDGHSSGLTAPNSIAQEALLRHALASAGIEPGEIDYIEAHGTGTSLGDPIEARALSAVFGSQHTSTKPLIAGSVKSNIGHLEAAAGVAGLIKVVLALQHEQIPPSLHFHKLNPHIEWGDTVQVPTEPHPWARGARRRLAGVSSFGFSGTNAHVILGDAQVPEKQQPKPERPLHIMTISARTDAALDTLVEQDAVELARTDASLADICYTANAGRAQFPVRTFYTGASKDDILRAPIARGRSEGVPEVVFLFPGQGAQYAGMGKELFDTQPVFRQAMEECAAHLAGKIETPLYEVLWGGATHLLPQTAYAQPALFAVEYSLARLWQSWGIEPAVVLGHSVGEYVAACIAGVYGLADGLKLIAARARLMQGAGGRGGMLAMQAGEAAARSAMVGLEQRVSLAAVNAPDSVVVSGYEEELGQVEQRLLQAGVRVKRLAVSHGFHSPQMAEIEEAWERKVAEVSFHKPQLEMISSVTGKAVRGEELSQASYWREQVRQPVRFAAAMEEVRAYGVFVEAGPGATLGGLGRQCLDQRERLWATSLRSGRGEWEQMLESLAALYVRGAEVDWEGFDKPYDRRKVSLPTYPFQRQRYWIETKPRKSQADGHGLLGRSLEIAGTSPTKVWESVVGFADQPYLADHRAMGNAIFPLTGYLEMALAAGGSHSALGDIVIWEPLVLAAEEDRTVQTIHRGDVLEIFSRQEGTWKQHFTARVLAAETPSQGVAPQASCGGMRRLENIDSLYADMRRRGMDFGPAFRTIQELWVGSGESIARVAGAGLDHSDVYHIHPAILDGCFQAIAAALPQGSEDLYLPARLERFQLHRASSRPLWSHAVRRPESKQNTTTFDLRVFDENGLVAEARGMEFVRVAARRQVPAFEVRWEEQLCGPMPAVMSGNWLILADRTGLGTSLAQELSGLGARCVLLTDSSQLKPTLSANDWSGVIDLWSLDASSAGERNIAALDAAQRQVCGKALEMVQALAAATYAHPPRLWLVTRGTQAISPVSDSIAMPQAMLWGMANAIAEEHPEWRCVRIDLDPAGPASEAASLSAEIAGGGEDRVAFRAAKRLVSRFAIRPPRNRIEQPKRLTTPSRGILENLQVLPAARHSKIPRGCVQIETRAAGLNFRDVLNVLGMFTGPLGSECVGRVDALGDGVEGLAEGDEVVAFAPGTHDGYVIADARLVAPKPNNLTSVEAATLPTAFLTAQYTLRHLAKIGAGDRVLIHAATGGVGLAAVQIAQRAGAEIFATAGSDRKRAFLRELGVPHIMDSRSLDFGREILERTGGRGVDIVLNSLAGDFIATSFSALAPRGRFIEIGKRDIWSAEQVAHLGKDIRYHIVDLGGAAIEEPEVIGHMLREIVKAVERQELRPLRAVQYGFDEAVAAYRYMAQAQHIGKVVLCQSRCAADIVADASYLVTGGFGGIGSQLLRWLVQRGARNVVLVGRHDPAAAAREAIAWAEAQGARVLVRLADIADMGQAATLFSEIAAAMPPLRGILHAAGLLDDGVLTEQTWDRFERVLAPKTIGSWILHQLASSTPLDFFVMFSSMAAILGAPGQANYAAANAFQDALAHERRRLGLPAISVNWGAWADGMAAREGLKVRQRRFGLEPMSAEEALRMLDYVLLDKPAQVAVGLIQWSKIAEKYGQDAGASPAAGSGDQEGHSRATDVSFSERLAAAPDTRRAALLSEHVHALALRVLGFLSTRRLDLQKPLSELGMDSLMAIEFRNILSTELGRNFPSTLLFNYPAIEDITAAVVELLYGDKGAKAPVEVSSEVSPNPLDIIEDLSDEEVDRLLAGKLGGANG
jgi:acyl transferase domain-containing protein/NADPH:quinone reductase-like Zn-dependent oxidoreductase/acyl carrier protein